RHHASDRHAAKETSSLHRNSGQDDRRISRHRRLGKRDHAMRDQMRREAEAHIRARRWAAAEASLADAHGAADLFIRALARGEQGDIAGARGDVRRGLLAGAPVGEAVALLTRFGLVHEALAAVAELSEADLRAGRIALHFGRYREGIAA